MAIVTGGASGFGRGMVERFVEEGAQVVIADVDREGGEAFAAELGPAAAFKQTDVADADQIQAAVDFAVERFGGLHVMCNNAGYRRVVQALPRRRLRRLRPRDGREHPRRDGGEPARGAAHGGARRWRGRQHHVDRRHQRGRRRHDVPRDEGGRHSRHPVGRGRAGGAGRARELHRACPHPDGDQRRISISR